MAPLTGRTRPGTRPRSAIDRSLARALDAVEGGSCLSWALPPWTWIAMYGRVPWTRTHLGTACQSVFLFWTSFDSFNGEMVLGGYLMLYFIDPWSSACVY